MSDTPVEKKPFFVTFENRALKGTSCFWGVAENGWATVMVAAVDDVQAARSALELLIDKFPYMTADDSELKSVREIEPDDARGFMDILEWALPPEERRPVPVALTVESFG